jgi:hypothetical protein
MFDIDIYDISNQLQRDIREYMDKADDPKKQDETPGDWLTRQIEKNGRKFFKDIAGIEFEDAVQEKYDNNEFEEFDVDGELTNSRENFRLKYNLRAIE